MAIDPLLGPGKKTAHALVARQTEPANPQPRPAKKTAHALAAGAPNGTSESAATPREENRSCAGGMRAKRNQR